MTDIIAGTSYKVKTEVNGKAVTRSARVKEIKPFGRGERITYTLQGVTYTVSGKDFRKSLAT